MEEKDRNFKGKNELNRRDFLERSIYAFGASAFADGIYELIDTFAHPPVRALADAVTFLPEQHILQDIQVIMDDGSGTSQPAGKIPVTVPPLHHQIVTAKLRVPSQPGALQEAQAHLESVLQRLEQNYAPTHNGLGITVAWGLPYFAHYIPALTTSSSYFEAGTRYPTYLPVDVQASKNAGKTVHAVLDAITFPGDQPPAGFDAVRLEQNDVMVILRSDILAHIAAGTAAIFGLGSDQAGSLFNVTSIRRGFAGGGFYGKQSLPCQMAQAAGIPAAEMIPANAELFLGFTSTHQAGLAPGRIANLESLPGLTDQWPNGYFLHGTTAHLSHVYEDLHAWYKGNASTNFSSFSDRVRAAFRPGLTVAEGTRTVPEDATQVESENDVMQDLKTHGTIGHSASLQPVTRLAQATTDHYGTTYPAATTMLQRSDFNTLDNPFFYSSNPNEDHYSSQPAAGVHFIFFGPTSDFFHRSRLAMDGHYANGTNLQLQPRSFNMGFNAILTTSHRQNFMVPPRVHRSFPLAEYLISSSDREKHAVRDHGAGSVKLQ